MIFYCTLNIWGILLRLWVLNVSPVLAGLLVTPREWGLWGAASCCCHVRAKVQVPPQPPPCCAEGNHSFIPTAPEQVGAPVPHVASTDSTLGPRGRVPCYMEQRWKCSLLWPQPAGGWGNLLHYLGEGLSPDSPLGLSRWGAGGYVFFPWCLSEVGRLPSKSLSC